MGGVTIHTNGATGRLSASHVANTENVSGSTTLSPDWVAREIKPEISVKSLRVDPYFAIPLGSRIARRMAGSTRSGTKVSSPRTNCPAVFADFPSQLQKVQFALWTLDQLQDRTIGENLAAGVHHRFVRLMIGYFLIGHLLYSSVAEFSIFRPALILQSKDWAQLKAVE